MAQNYMDYLTSLDPIDPGYDPVLQNINEPLPQQPAPQFMPSGMGAGFVPPVEGANVGAPIPESGPVVDLESTFAPTATVSDLGAPVPRMTSEETMTAPVEATLPLTPDASIVDTDIAAMKRTGREGREGAVSAAEAYKRQIQGLPPVPAIDVAGITAPVREGTKYYIERMKEFDKAQETSRPAVAQVRDKALEDAQNAYKAAEGNLETAELELEDIERNVASLDPVDADRFWKNRSTGNKILMGIAMALASVTPAGADRAHKALNTMIERDISEQKLELYRKQLGAKTARAAAKTRLELNMEKTKNKLAAIEMTRAEGYAKAKQEVTSKMKGLQNQAAINAANNTIANLDMKIAESKANALNAIRAEEEKKAASTYRVATDAAAAADRLAKTYGSAAQLNIAKLRAKQTGKDGVKPLGSEEKKRYDLIVQGKDAIADMKAALARGEKTFSVVGDNPYTVARRMWEEAIGRMQSGGAINEEEGKRFQAMAPTWADSAAIQKLKIKGLEKLVNQRLDTMLRR